MKPLGREQGSVKKGFKKYISLEKKILSKNLRKSFGNFI